MGDAEALLFIDDHEAQVAKLHPALQKGVRPDHDIDLALGHALERGAALPLTAKAAQHFDLDRVVGHACDERLKVLLCQDGRGHQHRDLALPHDGLEGGPHGHFGLAIPGIAAEQAVHGACGGHILLNGGDDVMLVLRFAVGKGRLELMLPWGVFAEGVATLEIALGLRFEHGRGHVGNGLLGRAALTIPAPPAQLVERRIGARDADVAAEQVGLRDGHVQAGVVGVLHREHFLLLAVERDLAESFVATDAVFDMHHQVARRQIGHLGNARRGPWARGAAGAERIVAAALLLVEAVEVGLGHQGQAEGFTTKPFGEHTAQDVHLAVPLARDGRLLDGGLQMLHGGGGIERDQDLVALVGARLQLAQHLAARLVEQVGLQHAAGFGEQIGQRFHIRQDLCGGVYAPLRPCVARGQDLRFLRREVAGERCAATVFLEITDVHLDRVGHGVHCLQNAGGRLNIFAAPAFTCGGLKPFTVVAYGIRIGPGHQAARGQVRQNTAARLGVLPLAGGGDAHLGQLLL